MPSLPPGGEQLLKIKPVIIGGLSLIGLVPILSPIVVPLKTGVEVGMQGLAYLQQVSTKHWCHGWFTDRGALNRDLAKALSKAFLDSIGQIEHDWNNHPYYNSLKQKDPGSAADTMFVLQRLREVAEQLVRDVNPFAGALDQAKANRLIQQDVAAIRSDLDNVLQAYLKTSDQEFASYIKKQLPDQWLLRFMNILNDPGEEGTRAWRTYQRLWEGSLQAAVEEWFAQERAALEQQQQKIDLLQQANTEMLAALRWLQEWAQRLASLPPEQRDPTGLEAMQAGIQEIRDRLDAIKADTGEIKATAMRIEANTDEILKRLPERQAEPAGPIKTLRPVTPGFTGRMQERAKLKAYLTSNEHSAPIVVISGMGGSGKTELANLIATELAAEYPDARLFVDMQVGMQPLQPEAVMGTVIHTFDEQAALPNDTKELHSLYSKLLGAKKHGLLLLDNASIEAQAIPLLPPDGWATIITSRRRLDLDGLLLDLKVLPEADALTLLITLLTEGNRHDITGRDSVRPLLQPLAKLCGYLPLALHIAAGFLKTNRNWPLERYVKKLEEAPLTFLKSGDKDVGRVLGVSINLLLQENTMLAEHWHLLAVFPAPFDADAATALLNLPEDEAFAVLTDLCQRNLLDYDETNDMYRLYDLLREYARVSIQQAGGTIPGVPDQGQWRDACIRHAQYYLTLGVDANKQYLQDRFLEALQSFDRILPHLRGAWDWMHRQSDVVAAGYVCAFATLMPNLLNLWLIPRQRLVYFEAGLEAARLLLNHDCEVQALSNLGDVYWDLGDAQKAIEYYSQSLQIAQELEDRLKEEDALSKLGIMYQALGDAQKAIEYHSQALQITREFKNPLKEGYNLNNLGHAYEALGDVQKAIEYYTQWLQIARELKDLRSEGQALHNLGHAYKALGDTEQAIKHYTKSLQIAREFEYHDSQEQVLHNLGHIYEDLGDAQKAIEYHSQALQITREFKDRKGEGYALDFLGIVYRGLGDAQKAIEYYSQSLQIAQELEDRLKEEDALYFLGTAYWDLSDAQKAIECYSKALEITRELKDRKGEADVSWTLGLLYEQEGDYTRAVELMQMTVNYEREIAHPDAEKDERYLKAVRRKAIETPKEVWVKIWNSIRDMKSKE